ncbi:RNA polymerase sigma factor, sigma-70 family [Thalassotalea agarivorans]|uniref:RNA polymerase sigma factor, sigma-70 family n=1 Tax=Thalassotalea agarivorans TaxID=349064 RepID=A0A1I0FHQ9_THASX|nr:RNA polymerase sigma factor, sigma-70 family [Thalassotalea agarivorans]
MPLANFRDWALDLLQQVLPFDGAIWATGHIETQEFHTQTTVDVSPQIFASLKETLAINPIFDALKQTPGRPIDMADVISDEKFYAHPLYTKCFKPYGIERILSSIHTNERSGIFTLLTLYRYDRDNGFSAEEKMLQQSLLFHLLCADTHRQMLALESTSGDSQGVSAIVDNKGIYHAVNNDYLDLIESYIENQQAAVAEFIAQGMQQFAVGELVFTLKPHGELFVLTVRLTHALDKLTQRESEIVQGICQGQTFKQIAKSLGLSPSTVSNHLYRIYNKLNINSRSELVALSQ